MKYKLTAYSHGAGCGCKLSPEALSAILDTNDKIEDFPGLIVGNNTKDDAAIMDFDGKTAILSTADFFMPIVDDPFDFGSIAAANALSDVYAMGGTPTMAIAILGWPIDKIPAYVASDVIRGGRGICHQAGIPLAGGHSIDTSEPIFGMAITGRIPIHQIKKNSDGQADDLLYLTKPLGIGIVTTAQKKKMAVTRDLERAKMAMISLNSIGTALAGLSYVHAMTDVTGFGLAGHLLEVCEGSGTSAILFQNKLPIYDFVEKYISLDCIPGGTYRNWKSYGHKILTDDTAIFKILADPQTSGGLLISIDPSSKPAFESFMAENGYELNVIGRLTKKTGTSIIEVN